MCTVSRESQHTFDKLQYYGRTRSLDTFIGIKLYTCLRNCVAPSNLFHVNAFPPDFKSGKLSYLRTNFEQRTNER